MRGASFEEFVRRPFGRYLLGDHHLLWCATPRQAGTVIWGRGDDAEAQQLVRGWDFGDRLEARYDSVVDLSGMTSVDPSAFDVVLRDMAARMPSMAQRVRRQALVRPHGMAGAIVAGFYPLLAPGFEWREFADRERAFAWCMPEDPTLASEVARIVDAAKQATPLVARLRHLLRADPSRAQTLAEVARALSVSTRTLQRELTDSDLKVEEIARRVGVRSVPSFVTLFRRLAGATPTEYRQRHWRVL